MTAFLFAFLWMIALMIPGFGGVLFAAWMGRGGPWGQSQ